jgi:hypothetical protein
MPNPSGEFSCVPNRLAKQFVRARGNHQMRISGVAALCAALAGCASHTGVVPNGQGGYLIAKQAATGFPGLGNLKAEAMGEASQYCVSQGREFLLTNAAETQPPYLLGNYPRAEIDFQCVAPQAPKR